MDRTQLLDRLGELAVDAPTIPDIARGNVRWPLEQRGGCLESSPVAREQGQTRTVTGDALGDGAADSGPCSRDDDMTCGHDVRLPLDNARK